MIRKHPNIKSLHPENPIRKRNLYRVDIDLSSLRKDIPETRIYGMELMPYDDYKAQPKKDRHHTQRERYLSDDELIDLYSRTSRKLWETYSDPEGRGFYASDVPHVSIITPSGKIDQKYLNFRNRSSK